MSDTDNSARPPASSNLLGLAIATLVIIGVNFAFAVKVVTDSIRNEMDIRFNTIEYRFDAVNRRFDLMERRFETIESRLREVNQALGRIKGRL